MTSPVLCAVIYRPPRSNKDFISELSSFLGDVVLKYDKVLLLGDFNIHVCFPSSLSKDFLNHINSLGFQQMVNGATHSHGHTLDLILSLGLPVSDIIIDDFVLADHNPIIFTVSFPCQHWVRSINSNTKVDFSETFLEMLQGLELDFFTDHSGVEESVHVFNSICFKKSILCCPPKAGKHEA